jgi:catechol 2,3-dioxygenase-like lactoylglutathione lyase family enzyme
VSYPKRSYVEHAAVRVKDIEWHVRFFREALGMDVRAVDGDPAAPKQVWTVGGVQLIADGAFEGPEGRLGHLGIMTEDLDAAIVSVERWDVRSLPQGRGWYALPDGLCIELIQAKGDAVSRVLSIDPRA